MYPSPGLEKLKQVRVTSDIPPPPKEWKSWNLRSMWHFGSGWCTPPEIEIGLNMNAIEKNHFKRGHKVHFTIYPPPFQYHYLILCLNRKLVNFNFKWIWIYGLKPHWPPLTSPPKNEMLVFRLCSTSHDRPGWSMDLNPIHHPSPAQKMKCSFLDVHFWWSARLVNGLEPHPPPLSSQKMLVFGLHSTSDDRPGWSMDSNPICHPSPAKKMKCLFFD